MSRSYRHTPCCSIISKGMKQFANKRVRHYPDIVNGNFYRKISQQYDICDHKITYFRNEFIHLYEEKLKERVINNNRVFYNPYTYYKHYVRK